MASLAHTITDISVEDYLTGEQLSEVKHEYVNGQVFAMAGASLNHNLISGNTYGLLWNHLKGQPCYPLTAGMLLKTDNRKFRYPDVQVVCEDDNSDDEHVRENPILIVEVLSRSTRRFDKTKKRAEYLALPSLLEYVLIEQDVAEVEVQRRNNNWQSEYFYLGQDIYFEAVEATVSVEDIYQRVDNKDVEAFLLAQRAAVEDR